ncbi:hypothetical protein [Streptomyces lasiicapitis]|uniref:hypothetical protein n=1 Tax=Streptomyces lasiicapitis TaxID=1923961 RepID=UPI00365A9164
MTAEPTVTITVHQLETALRGWLAHVDYDIHKNFECGEETGEDTYPAEAATVFEHLQGVTAAATEQPAVEAAAACGKCKQPFDPADTRFDGHARHGLTDYCRRCVDACHDNEIADHRCVICA